MFNIASLAIADTSTLHLKGIDDELLFADEAKTLPVTVTLHSPGSAAYAAADARRNDRVLALMKRKGSNKMPSAAELRPINIKFLAECTAWDTNLGHEDAPDAVGTQLYEVIYADRRIGFIHDQTKAHLDDWVNFPKASATS